VSSLGLAAVVVGFSGPGTFVPVDDGHESEPKSVEEQTLFSRVGGESFFVELVERFYQGVEPDELLRPMYPDDLEPGKAHLALFLIQYWGGPSTYQATRGHPRLRMRHNPFVINKRARDAWLAHMNAAVNAMTMGEDDRSELLAYFDMAAHQLRNR
jgi:hemoglobin